MQIEFATEGGIAYFPGLSQPVTIDLDLLSDEERVQLQELLGTTNFFDLPSQMGVPGTRGADRQTYTIRIDGGETQHMVRLSEPIEDEGLQELVTLLQRKAQEIRKSGQ